MTKSPEKHHAQENRESSGRKQAQKEGGQEVKKEDGEGVENRAIRYSSQFSLFDIDNRGAGGGSASALRGNSKIAQASVRFAESARAPSRKRAAMSHS
jgi:hypothetical protein